jgi:hypothetical protein
MDRVEDWPESTSEGEADRVKVMGKLTVTVTVLVAVPPSESVTSTQ